MNSNLHYWNIDDPKSGPIEKFYLLKLHAKALQSAGYQLDDLQRMSCAELRRAIKTFLFDRASEKYGK